MRNLKEKVIINTSLTKGTEEILLNEKIIFFTFAMQNKNQTFPKQNIQRKKVEMKTTSPHKDTKIWVSK